MEVSTIGAKQVGRSLPVLANVIDDGDESRFDSYNIISEIQQFLFEYFTFQLDSKTIKCNYHTNQQDCTEEGMSCDI